MTTTEDDKRLHSAFLDQLGSLYTKCGHVIHEIADIVEKKGHDYENDEVKFADYYEEGLRDLWLLINRKTLRLKSLIGRGSLVRGPEYEKIEQEAMELASFAVFFSAWARTVEVGALKKVGNE